MATVRETMLAKSNIEVGVLKERLSRASLADRAEIGVQIGIASRRRACCDQRAGTEGCTGCEVVAAITRAEDERSVEKRRKALRRCHGHYGEVMSNAVVDAILARK